MGKYSQRILTLPVILCIFAQLNEFYGTIRRIL